MGLFSRKTKEKNNQQVDSLLKRIQNVLAKEEEFAV